MTENKEPSDHSQIHKDSHSFIHNIDRSALWMIIGVVLLFSSSIIVTLIAPRYIDASWTTPSSPYQVQMYEVEDPHLYLSSAATGGKEVQYVHHLKQGYTLIAFQETENLKILAPKELESYVTHYDDAELKLTSRLLFLRQPKNEMKQQAEQLQTQLQREWEKSDLQKKEESKLKKIHFQILELFDPQLTEGFSFDPTAGIIPNWVDENFRILDETPQQQYHQDYGVVYVLNPIEYRVRSINREGQEKWLYDIDGASIKSLEELTKPSLGFRSRKDLIELGEHLYAIEGCWYCHTDQTRTLIQDTVLNGSDSYPAPPSSANEYIYQKITFAGTRRIGPDISRTAIKRPSRDWHIAHFWAPKTASIGSIMPAFQHFFDNDPRGTGKNMTGIPNYKFEAMYQYLMTKGSRITPPTQAWWLGKDPVKTIQIIQGKRKLS